MSWIMDRSAKVALDLSISDNVMVLATRFLGLGVGIHLGAVVWAWECPTGVVFSTNAAAYKEPLVLPALRQLDMPNADAVEDWRLWVTNGFEARRLNSLVRTSSFSIIESAWKSNEVLRQEEGFGNGAAALVELAGNYPIESKPEVRSKAQGEEPFGVQAPPPLSTLPVKVMAAIGVIFLLLTCSLLVYKLIQDWKRQEATSKEACFMDIDHNKLHGEKVMYLKELLMDPKKASSM
ncbi:hypothetical protein DFH28DRAFT_926702 [Melampsora americana]|nr:hypothetical protein DFH28DRAFT_926702 [Melampsora americana]